MKKSRRLEKLAREVKVLIELNQPEEAVTGAFEKLGELSMKKTNYYYLGQVNKLYYTYLMHKRAENDNK